MAGSHDTRLDVQAVAEVVSWEAGFDGGAAVARMTERRWIRGLARSSERERRLSIFGSGMKK